MNLLNLHCCFVIFLGISHAQNVNIARRIVNYFNSYNVRSFREIWKKQEMSYETAFLAMLRENYGRPAMNVYVQKMFDTHKIADAFYVSDNVLDVLMKDLRLVHLPILTAPEVDIDLDSNVARFKGVLDKVIVQAKYTLFRNHTAVVFSGSDQNLRKTSPFSLQQVQSKGQLSITADGCRLTGLAIAKLSGVSVNLGHDNFNIDNCELNVEIWSPGLGSPPIIAPYFSKEQGTQLERLLSKPMRDELMPKLQAAMYSYINTSAVFGKDLPKFRVQQSKLFQHTSAYLRNVVMNYNKRVVARRKDTLTLANKSITWLERIKSRVQYIGITISNVTLHGLDTAYLSHSGGPYKHNKPKIEDQIRFNNLQVRGEIDVQNGVIGTFWSERRKFGAELHDVVVNLVVDVGAEQLSLQRLEVACWRKMELNHFEIDLVSSRSLLTGYITNEIPKAVNQEARVLMAEALKQTGNKKLQTEPYEYSKNIESTKETKNDNIEDDDNNVKQSSSDADVNNEHSDHGKISENSEDIHFSNTREDVDLQNDEYNKKDDESNTNDSTVNNAGDENDNENFEHAFSDTAPDTNYNSDTASHKKADDDVLKVKVNVNNDNSENDDNSNINNSAGGSEEDENSNENLEHSFSDAVPNTDYNSDTASQKKGDDDILKLKVIINNDNSENDGNSNINNSAGGSEEEENSNENLEHAFSETVPGTHYNSDTASQKKAEDDILKVTVNINNDNSENDDNANINSSASGSEEDENSNENRNSEHKIGAGSHQSVDQDIKVKVNISKDNLGNDDDSNIASATNTAEDENRENRNPDFKSNDLSQQNFEEENIRVKVNINKDASENDDNDSAVNSADNKKSNINPDTMPGPNYKNGDVSHQNVDEVSATNTAEDENRENGDADFKSGDLSQQNFEEENIRVKVNINKDASENDDNDSAVNSADNKKSKINPDTMPGPNYKNGDVSHQNVDEVSATNTAEDENRENGDADFKSGDLSQQNFEEENIRVKVNINKDASENDDNDSAVNSADNKNPNINSDTVPGPNYKNGDGSHQNDDEDVINKDTSENNFNSNNRDKAMNNPENEIKENIKDCPNNSLSTYNKSGNAQDVKNTDLIKMKVNIHPANSAKDDDEQGDVVVGDSNADSKMSAADIRKHIKKNIQRKYNNPSNDNVNNFIKQKSIYPFRGFPVFDNEIHSE